MTLPRFYKTLFLPSLAGVLISSGFSPSVAHAAVDIQQLFYRIGQPGNHSSAQQFAASPGSMITTFLPNIILLAGIIFFAMTIWNGFTFMRLAGSKNPQEIAKMKASLTYSFVGFLLVVSAYFILQILSTVTGVKFLNPPTT